MLTIDPWKTKARAPVSTPSLQAMEERTDSTLSCSPSFRITTIRLSLNLRFLISASTTIADRIGRWVSRPSLKLRL
jgi:hypothetical protein